MLTTGVNNLAAFADIDDVRFFVRLIEEPKEPLALPNAETVIVKPPYRVDDEMTLFRLLGVDMLVTKNAGGEQTYAKLDAARRLGIEVVMIDRPARGRRTRRLRRW